MERQAELSKFRRGVAALVVIVPVLLAGCVRESPAYVVQPDRSEAPADYEGQGRYFTVVVRRGESVSEIAERCDVSVATVEGSNDLDNHRPIYPGQVLRIPSFARAERNCERREPQMARDGDDYGAVRPLPRPHRETQVRYEPGAVPSRGPTAMARMSTRTRQPAATIRSPGGPGGASPTMRRLRIQGLCDSSGRCKAG